MYHPLKIAIGMIRARSMKRNLKLLAADVELAMDSTHLEVPKVGARSVQEADC